VGLIRAARALDSSRIETRFLGQLTNGDVLGYYRDNPVDVFVNSSISEGVPVAMMEACAHGVPIAAPAVGGIPELVDGSSGMTFSENAEPSVIARAILDTVEDPSTHAALRAGARRTFERTCKADVNYRAFAAKLRAIREGSRTQLHGAGS
jgi:glycosyltransferase involved in cell wall biosynthesis